MFAADVDHTVVFEKDAPLGAEDSGRSARIGLGLDAGGTYTDIVLYDFQRGQVIAKAKSLTTKWDFTIGIGRALDQLDPAALTSVDLISISTTLATNAIVEGRGQKVGLLILPPYGLFEPADITYRPIGILEGKLEIDGREITPVNPEQARREIRRLVDKERVAAFAVSGYAGHVNPSHELQVQRIAEQETGLSVTCAHELSGKIDYRIRSITAALNASIIPCLGALLTDVDETLRSRGITAPPVVVKSDGTLTSLPLARRRPIETILSGPAASVAGASYLAGLDNAMVVDMGGTTTDTAAIRGGVIQTRRQGASIGGWRTHVGSLDMRTLGLGGDSLIARSDGQLSLGPWRVAPVAWTLRDGAGEKALEWLDANLERFRTSTQGMELLAATDGNGGGDLTGNEQRLLDTLLDGPCSLDQLAIRLGAGHWRSLPVEPLERRHLVVRSSLTPTDLLHAADRLELWNVDAARRFCGFFCRLLGCSQRELAQLIHDMIVRRLAAQLLKKQLDERTDADELESSATSAALIHNWLDGGADDDYKVRVVLKHPVVGIGAPAHIYIPDVAKLLETKAVIPPHADVANAIGAITGRVFIRKRVEISLVEDERYVVAGLPDAPSFGSVEDAHCFAIDQLLRIVREQAREAGTSEARVEIRSHDCVGLTADGDRLFLSRSLTAQLSGRPDLAQLTRAQ